MIPVCPNCLSGAKTIAGSPFADGYHRRHQCSKCPTSFHTLAPYNGKEAEVSFTPFKDRPLTPEEEQIRLDWWDEDDNLLPAEVKPRNFIHRCRIALATPEEERNEADLLICNTLEVLRDEVEKLDDED